MAGKIGKRLAEAGCLEWMTVALVVLFLVSSPRVSAQSSSTAGTSPPPFDSTQTHSTQDYNQRLLQLLQQATGDRNSTNEDYRIGADDLLEVSVYEAPDLNRTVRVSADGQISLPPLGTVRAAGLTATELAAVLEELLRRTYMKDPHVGVFVKEVQSHPVSVFGAVGKPGVYQIRGPRSLLEVLSMAEGLADDAGDSVIVMQYGGNSAAGAASDQPPHSAPGDDPPTDPPPQGSGVSAALATTVSATTSTSTESSTEVDLKELLDSADSRYNVMVYPGDVVKVPRAGIVYVIGEVNKPGGYVLKTNENISVLQAIALAEGLTRTSSAKHARIIRTDPATGARKEIRINLSKILSGHAPDPVLQAKDIIFVPNSAAKAALYHSTEGILGIASGAAIYRY